MFFVVVIVIGGFCSFLCVFGGLFYLLLLLVCFVFVYFLFVRGFLVLFVCFILLLILAPILFYLFDIR